MKFKLKVKDSDIIVKVEKITKKDDDYWDRRINILSYELIRRTNIGYNPPTLGHMYVVKKGRPIYREIPTIVLDFNTN